jgi:hypothetical protein
VVRTLFAVTAVGTVALWAWTLTLTDGNLAHVLEENLAIVPAVAYLSGLMLLLLCVPIWLIHLVFSHARLSRFAYGPFEWLWRAGTYLPRPAPKARN